MSRKYAPTYRFDLQPSILRQRWSLLLHGAAAAACLFNPLSWWIKAALCALVMGGFRLDLKRRAKPAVSTLRVGADGRWFATDAASGESGPIEIGADTCVSTWIVALQWRGGGRERWLAIFPDSLPEDQFRQLRVALRSVRPKPAE